MESPIGPQVQMLQEGVLYLQRVCEMFARPERTSGEIVVMDMVIFRTIFFELLVFFTFMFLTIHFAY